MRLGRKLSEGFAVDRDAEDAAPTPEADRADAGRAVPVTAEAEAAERPVASGRRPAG